VSALASQVGGGDDHRIEKLGVNKPNRTASKYRPCFRESLLQVVMRVELVYRFGAGTLYAKLGNIFWA
jgi:hypothetical protein